MKRSGVADLPLHGGRVPQWLATRMTTLGTAISESVIHHYGHSVAFAHGGKDSHPFPVPLKTYDESIAVLRRSLDAAKVGNTDKIDGMKRLDRFVRAIEKRFSPEADFDAVMAHEHAISKSLDGRTVFDPSTRGDAPAARHRSLGAGDINPVRPHKEQLQLFD